MAKYRQVHTTFWDDGFVVDLTPEEKYFYLYLMTNNNTTQCGIYELPYRIIEMQTGYNRDTVIKLLERFKQYGKIEYNEPTKEIMLVNWAKYNFINSPKVKKCIEKELQAVKHKAFVKEYANSLKRLGYGIDTLSIDYGEEEEKEEEKEEEQEREEEKKKNPPPPSPLIDQDLLRIKNHFETKVIFCEAAYVQTKALSDFMDDGYDTNLIIKAMDIAVERGKPHLPYINGILKQWRLDGITNMQQLLAKEAQVNGINPRHHAGHNGPSTSPVPSIITKRSSLD